jgi:uncharacterized SAM-binding protein YcdF (DUF218 family)
MRVSRPGERVSGRGWCHAAGRILVTSLAGLGFLSVLVSVTPLVSWCATALAGPWDDPTGDVLIVLAGSSLDGGLIGESSYWRATYAMLAWRAGVYRRVVVSGGPAHQPIAPGIGDFLISQGVPREAIVLETRSRNTRENALYLRDLLGGSPGTKVLLTSDYHMFRARRTFAKVGLEVQPMPYPDVRKRATRWTGRWPAFLDLVDETAKIGYYWARGWI